MLFLNIAPCKLNASCQNELIIILSPYEIVELGSHAVSLYVSQQFNNCASRGNDVLTKGNECTWPTDPSPRAWYSLHVLGKASTKFIDTSSHDIQEPNAFWKKVIISIHDSNDFNLHTFGVNSASLHSPSVSISKI